MWKERAVSNASTFAVATKGDSLYCQMSSTDEFESSVPAAEPVAEGRKRVAAVSASRSLVVGAAVVTMVTCCRRSKASIARSELVDVLGAVAGSHRRYCWQTRRWLALSAPRLGGRGDELWSIKRNARMRTKPHNTFAIEAVQRCGRRQLRKACVRTRQYKLLFRRPVIHDERLFCEV